MKNAWAHIESLALKRHLLSYLLLNNKIDQLTGYGMIIVFLLDLKLHYSYSHFKFSYGVIIQQ